MKPQETLDDFASTLAAVTGVQVDLRGAASPAGGWITFGGTGWWSFVPFGSPLFSVGLNTQALANWAAQVTSLDGIVDELAAGTLGLMDVRRLWDAEQTIRLHTDHLSSAGAGMKNAALLFGGADPGVAGSAAEEIYTSVNGWATDLGVYHDKFAGPPAIPDVLHDAGAALAAFGLGMANAYRESALHSAVADGLNGIAANMQNYLARQTVTTDDVAQILAGYSSSAGGALPAGMAGFGGDLTQAAVWSAANAAITNWINAELDTLDSQARTLASTLKKAYKTAADALRAVSGDGQVRLRARTEARQVPDDGVPRSQARTEAHQVPDDGVPRLRARTEAHQVPDDGVPRSQARTEAHQVPDDGVPRPQVRTEAHQAGDPPAVVPARGRGTPTESTRGLTYRRAGRELSPGAAPSWGQALLPVLMGTPPAGVSGEALTEGVQGEPLHPLGRTVESSAPVTPQGEVSDPTESERQVREELARSAAE